MPVRLVWGGAFSTARSPLSRLCGVSSESENGRRTEPRAPVHGQLAAWVRYRGRDLRLTASETVLGRSAACEIVLDDGLVSRRHAQINLGAERVELVDLGSVNGVYVNGVRVEGSRTLLDGDRILIGKQELMVRASRVGGIDSVTMAGRYDRSSAETLSGMEAAAVFTPAAPSIGEPSGDTEATRKGDALDLLGGVADKVLAMGRGAEAERILANYLRNLMVSARNGGPELEDPRSDKAIAFAIKLAQATQKGSWVNYAIELGRLRARPLPAPIVEDLYHLVRQMEIDLKELRAYVTVLKRTEASFGPAERFVVQRIEGLERLVSAR